MHLDNVHLSWSETLVANYMVDLFMMMTGEVPYRSFFLFLELIAFPKGGFYSSNKYNVTIGRWKGNWLDICHRV